jgi:hypothetical protein
MIKKVAVSAGVTLVVLVAVWFWGLTKDSAPTSKGSLQAAETSNETIDRSTSETPSATADTVGGGTPKIFFPDTSHDFGSVSQGSKVSYKFVVRNIGDAPLKLIKAKAS